MRRSNRIDFVYSRLQREPFGHCAALRIDPDGNYKFMRNSERNPRLNRQRGSNQGYGKLGIKLTIDAHYVRHLTFICDILIIQRSIQKF